MSIWKNMSLHYLDVIEVKVSCHNIYWPVNLPTTPPFFIVKSYFFYFISQNKYCWEFIAAYAVGTLYLGRVLVYMKFTVFFLIKCGDIVIWDNEELFFKNFMVLWELHNFLYNFYWVQFFRSINYIGMLVNFIHSSLYLAA